MECFLTFKFCSQNFRFSFPACCSNWDAPCCNASARSSNSESFWSLSKTFSTFVFMISTTYNINFWRLNICCYLFLNNYLINLCLSLLKTPLRCNLLRGSIRGKERVMWNRKWNFLVSYLGPPTTSPFSPVAGAAARLLGSGPGAALHEK